MYLPARRDAEDLLPVALALLDLGDVLRAHVLRGTILTLTFRNTFLELQNKTYDTYQW